MKRRWSSASEHRPGAGSAHGSSRNQARSNMIACKRKRRIAPKFGTQMRYHTNAPTMPSFRALHILVCVLCRPCNRKAMLAESDNTCPAAHLPSNLTPSDTERSFRLNTVYSHLCQISHASIFEATMKSTHVCCNGSRARDVQANENAEDNYSTVYCTWHSDGPGPGVLTADCWWSRASDVQVDRCRMGSSRRSGHVCACCSIASVVQGTKGTRMSVT